jgi:hypothetical protein
VDYTRSLFDSKSPVNTNVPIKPEALLLPQLAGYGELPPLYVAMSLDPVLLGMVRDFSRQEPLSNGLQIRVEDMLLRWAGADDIDPESRGRFVDARHLATMEGLTGSQFLQHGSAPNPGQNAAIYLESTWSAAVEAVSARLMVQVPAFGFSDQITLDLVHDRLVPVSGMEAAVTALTHSSPTSFAEAFSFWQQVVPVLELTRSDSNYDPELFLEQLGGSLRLFGLDEYLETLEAFGRDRLLGTPGADRLRADGHPGCRSASRR